MAETFDVSGMVDANELLIACIARAQGNIGVARPKATERALEAGSDGEQPFAPLGVLGRRHVR
jgi:hypothetical protein